MAGELVHLSLGSDINGSIRVPASLRAGRAGIARARRSRTRAPPPATPVSATPIGAERLLLNGQTLPLRPSMGLLTQPIPFIGLLVVAVPVWSVGPLPIGVQIIAAPWREDLALRAAAHLERIGILSTKRPQHV